MHSNIENRTVLGTNLEISFPTPVPLYHNPPNREYLSQWADNQITPMLRGIAHQLKDNLQHVPFDDFLKQLQATITAFHKNTRSEPYCIFIANRLEQTGNSDLWMIGLALEYGQLRRPKDIVSLDRLPSYLLSNPEVKHILCLDDAAYSGTQKATAFSKLFKETLHQKVLSLDLSTHLSEAEQIAIREDALSVFKGRSLWIGIPYISEYAYAAIEKASSFILQTEFLCHQKMLNIGEFLSDKQKNYIENLDAKSLKSSRTITYFDHRVPDAMSTVPELFTGDGLFPLAETSDVMQLLGYTHMAGTPGLIVLNHEQYNDFARNNLAPSSRPPNLLGYNIPVIVSPYDLRLQQYKQKLESAIQYNQIGQLSDRRLPWQDEDIQSLLRTTAVKDEYVSKAAFPYQPTVLSLNQQKAIDQSILNRKVSSRFWLSCLPERPETALFFLVMLYAIFLQTQTKTNSPETDTVISVDNSKVDVADLITIGAAAVVMYGIFKYARRSESVSANQPNTPVQAM